MLLCCSEEDGKPVNGDVVTVVVATRRVKEGRGGAGSPLGFVCLTNSLFYHNLYAFRKKIDIICICSICSSS